MKLLSVFVGLTLGADVVLNWEITYVNDIDPFQNSSLSYSVKRRMIGINNQWPIPLVNITYNDTLIINVKNSLDKPTSLHKHGLFQVGNNQMDGPVMITQCPIPPNATFQYVVPIQQWGTYWIHGHILGEYVDGLRTPLIINPPPDKFIPYDMRFLVSFSDWYITEHPILLSAFLNLYNPGGLEPVPDSMLINEKPFETFYLPFNQSILIRFVSMTSLGAMDVWCEGHDMYIVELDGVDIQPALVSSFSVSAAQRVSIRIQTREKGNGTDVNYILHATLNLAMFDQPPPGLVEDYSIFLIYNNDTNAEWFVPDNTTTPPDFSLWVSDFQGKMEPVEVIEAYGTPQSSFLLPFDFQVFSDGINHGTFNQTVFLNPKVPSLFTVATIGEEFLHNPAVYGPNTLPMIVEEEGIVELVVINNDPGLHPFHLHGHVFQVVVCSNNTYDPEAPVIPDNPANPVRRDVITIPPFGYTILRFRSDNPGVWLFHCHIEWHFEAGLTALLVERPKDLARIQGVTNGVKSLSFVDSCTGSGFKSAGNAAGNQGDDLTGYEVGPVPLVDGITASGWGALAGCAAAAIVGILTVLWFSRNEEDEEK